MSPQSPTVSIWIRAGRGSIETIIGRMVVGVTTVLWVWVVGVVLRLGISEWETVVLIVVVIVIRTVSPHVPRAIGELIGLAASIAHGVRGVLIRLAIPRTDGNREKQYSQKQNRNNYTTCAHYSPPSPVPSLGVHAKLEGPPPVISIEAQLWLSSNWQTVNESESRSWL